MECLRSDYNLVIVSIGQCLSGQDELAFKGFKNKRLSDKIVKVGLVSNIVLNVHNQKSLAKGQFSYCILNWDRRRYFNSAHF